MSELISVIVPVYNVEKYLSKSIDSIINQTYSCIEIILVDDGSTDKSGQICDELGMKDNRIRTIHKKNGGVSSARNRGIDEAKGQYIVFVDADDWVEEKYIEYLARLITEDNVQLGMVGYVKRRNITDVLSDECINNKKIEINREEALNLILANEENLGYIWNKIYFKKIIVENQIRYNENILLWEDLLFCCEYISKVQNISFFNAKLYNYYEREGSAVNTNSLEKELSKVYAAEHIKKVADSEVALCYLNSKSDFVKLSNWLCAKAYYSLLMYMAKNRVYKDIELKEEIMKKIRPYFFYLSIHDKLGFILILKHIKRK